MGRLPIMTHVEARPDYVLYVEFDDGVRGQVSLAHLLDGEVFRPLNDPAFFARVYLDPETEAPTWPNGVDVAPDAIHAEIVAMIDHAV